MNKYLLYTELDRDIIQIVQCPESEIEMYGDGYIVCPDNFEIDPNKVQKVINGVVISEDRTDELYLKQVFKEERQKLLNNLKVTYKEIIYQADEISQTRMNRAILNMNDDEVITWVAKNNSIQTLNKEDLRAIARLAGIAQTELWIQGEIK